MYLLYNYIYLRIFMFLCVYARMLCEPNLGADY